MKKIILVKLILLGKEICFSVFWSGSIKGMPYSFFDHVAVSCVCAYKNINTVTHIVIYYCYYVKKIFYILFFTVTMLLCVSYNDLRTYIMIKCDRTKKNHWLGSCPLDGYV